MTVSRNSLVWKLMVPVPLVTALVIIAAFISVPWFVERSVTDTALFAARDTVKGIIALRGYYSRYVVDVVNGRDGIEPADDHKTDPDKIPLPVTLIHDLSDLIEEDGIKLRLYSPYPFPSRKDRPFGDYEKTIWAQLVANPEAEIVRTKTEGGKTTLLVAVADRMQSESCVHCHNTSAYSPKKDWVVGDVRGVLEVGVDLTDQMAQGRLLGNWIMLGVFVFGSVVATFVVSGASRAIRPLVLLTNAMVRLSEGDDNVQMVKSARKDEIGAIARAVEAFRATLIQNRELENRQRADLEKMIRVRTSLLMEEQERLRLIFETAVDGIIIFNDESEIETLNHAAATMFGYEMEDLLGLSIGKLMPEKEREIFEQFLKHFKETGTLDSDTSIDNFRGLRADGSTFPVHAAFSHGTLGKRHLFTAMMYDASAQAAREAELRDAKERAEDANRAKSEFLSAMSHELRTPMNGILGFTQMLKYTPPSIASDTHDDYIEHILSAGNHLLSLIDDILDLAKIESGKITLTDKSVDPATLIAECVALVQAMARERSVLVNPPTIAEDVPVFEADPLRLKQVVVNLLSNAVKYNKENGEVFIEVTREEDWVRFTVRDTGIGIAQTDLEIIGTPFSRMVDHTKPIEGTGIGLAVSRKLVQLMGGTVGVESTVGVGSVFWFKLPLHPIST